MKNFFRFAAVLGLFAVSCSQFPTRYERIEPDKVRAIGFTMSPQAEGAPGDTMRIRAFFGGEPVASVSWQLSYDFIISEYGSVSILNWKPLSIITANDRLPDSIDISFVIPDSAFFLTQAIPPVILEGVRAALPTGMQSMTQREYAAFLSDIGSINLDDIPSLEGFIGRWGPAMGVSEVSPSSIETILGVVGPLVQAFSIRGELMATATSTTGHTLKIKGEFTIRYNNRFREFFPVNRNPVVRWIGVYKVKNTAGRPDAMGTVPAMRADDSLTWIYNELMPWKVRDTVLIEKGYSYYLAADSGIAAFPLIAGDSILTGSGIEVFTADTTFVCDTVLDTRVAMTGAPGNPVIDTETYTYDWQYQNLALDNVTMPLDSLFVIVGAGEYGGRPPVMQFLPSLDHHMTKVRIWVTVSDQLLGEYNRPVGKTTRVADLHFKYAD